MRWPRPCRARKATRLPSNVPTAILSDGSPNGVLTAISRILLRPFIEYNPLPPMTPISATGPFVRADVPFVSFAPAMRFSWDLPVQIHRLDFDFTVTIIKGGCGDVGIVAKDDHPVFAGHAWQPTAFRFERSHGIEVVGHDPRQRNMVPCRQQIRNKGQRFAAARQQDRLNIGVVARNGSDGDAGKNRLVADREIPETSLRNGHEILRKVAGTVAFGGRGGVFELSALNDVTRAGEGRHSAVV